MIRTVGLAFLFALGTTLAYAEEDEVPAAELEKVQATLTALGCTGFEEIEKEAVGIYEIDDAKCKMGTVDIKLDKDFTVILISRD